MCWRFFFLYVASEYNLISVSRPGSLYEGSWKERKKEKRVFDSRLFSPWLTGIVVLLFVYYLLFLSRGKYFVIILSVVLIRVYFLFIRWKELDYGMNSIKSRFPIWDKCLKLKCLSLITLSYIICVYHAAASCCRRYSMMMLMMTNSSTFPITIKSIKQLHLRERTKSIRKHIFFSCCQMSGQFSPWTLQYSRS